MSKHMNKNGFPFLLKSARVSAGLSRELLSDLSAIPLSRIIKFEIGSKSPSLQEVATLGKAIGVPVETLFGEPVSQTDGVFFDAKSSVERLIHSGNH